MVISIEPIKIGDQHYVAVTIGGSEMEPKGPFDAVTAEAVANWLIRFSRALSGGRHG